jgi:large subunit ribosomal protein L9
MATSEILLLKPIEHLGAEGDLVTVRAGYFRNFLGPKKHAVPVNKANRKYIEALQKARADRERKELAHSEELASQLNALNIAIAVKTGEGGKLFGSVTVLDVMKKLAEAGFELDRKQVLLQDAIKTLGEHRITIKLHPKVSVAVKIEVVSENPLEVQAK